MLLEELEKIIDKHLEKEMIDKNWSTALIGFQHTNSRILIEWKLKIELINALKNLRVSSQEATE